MCRFFPAAPGRDHRQAMARPEEPRPQVMMEDKPNRFIGQTNVPGFCDLMRQQLAGPQVEAIATGPWPPANPAGQALSLARAEPGTPTWPAADFAQPPQPLRVVALHEGRHRLAAAPQLGGHVPRRQAVAQPAQRLQPFPQAAVGFAPQQVGELRPIDRACHNRLLGHALPPVVEE